MAEDIQKLTLHAAWSAANERSFLYRSAARDQAAVAEAAEALRRRGHSCEAVEAMTRLAQSAAWHAANTRRFMRNDAEKDRRGVEFYTELLEGLTSRELARLVKQLSMDAAWHAANTRSMLWKDAAKDIRNFQRTAAALSSFLGDGEHSEGFRTPLGSDDEAEDGMPTGRIPGAAGYSTNLPEEGISNVTGARSVLDEALDGWKETSEKMTSSDRDQICARSFVTAALATVVVFDSFGKLLQSFQADMRKNVRMIQQHISHDSVTLQDLIDGECQRAGSYAQAIVEGSAAMGLLWLTRALRLLEKTLQALLDDPAAPFHKCIQQGYEASLRPHHNWVTRNVIQAAVRAAPTRQEFLAKLQVEPTAAQQIQQLLKVYSPVLRKTHEYLRHCGYET